MGPMTFAEMAEEDRMEVSELQCTHVALAKLHVHLGIFREYDCCKGAKA